MTVRRGSRVAGQPLPAIAPYEYRDPSAADPPAIIPVEYIQGPIFLVSGADDRLWPSPAYANAIMARLDGAHDPYPHGSVVEPGAGHGVAVAVPYGPAPGPTVLTQYGRLTLGGSRQANAAGLADSWPKLLAFLAAAAQ